MKNLSFFVGFFFEKFSKKYAQKIDIFWWNKYNKTVDMQQAIYNIKGRDVLCHRKSNSRKKKSYKRRWIW